VRPNGALRMCCEKQSATLADTVDLGCAKQSIRRPRGSMTAQVAKHRNDSGAHLTVGVRSELGVAEVELERGQALGRGRDQEQKREGPHRCSLSLWPKSKVQMIKELNNRQSGSI